jgi:hypothetical protein
VADDITWFELDADIAAPPGENIVRSAVDPTSDLYYAGADDGGGLRRTERWELATDIHPPLRARGCPEEPLGVYWLNPGGQNGNLG